MEKITFEEFTILATGMKQVYQAANFLPTMEAVEIWYQLLQDLDYQTLSAAIQKYMITGKYPPTIAEIRELAIGLTNGERPIWTDGWEEVIRSIQQYGRYRELEALASMSEITRKVVKSLGYQSLCDSENLMADRAQFRMAFEQLEEKQYQKSLIPGTLAKQIEECRRGPALPGHSEQEDYV